MANPEHIPKLDGFDRFTVSLYRMGIFGSSIAVLWLTGALVKGLDSLPAVLLLDASIALCVLNMHLYDKQVRWFIATTGSLGLVLQLFAQLGAADSDLTHVLVHAGLGFVFVAQSGFAMKEQFCFRIPGLRLTPIFLAIAVFAMFGGKPLIAVPFLLLTGGLGMVLAVAKVRMPLHFDIGDKSRYQI